MSKNNGFIGVIILVIIAFIALGGGYYAYHKKQQGKILIQNSKSPINELNSTINTNAPTTTTQVQGMAVNFEDQLNACIKYKTAFKHPLTGETLEKEILGIINSKCDYVEQMPNGGKMECKYSESQRKAVAQYYKDIAVSKNDKIVVNPLQEAIDSGACVVSGY